MCGVLSSGTAADLRREPTSVINDVGGSCRTAEPKVGFAIGQILTPSGGHSSTAGHTVTAVLTRRWRRPRPAGQRSHAERVSNISCCSRRGDSDAQGAAFQTRAQGCWRLSCSSRGVGGQPFQVGPRLRRSLEVAVPKVVSRMCAPWGSALGSEIPAPAPLSPRAPSCLHCLEPSDPTREQAEPEPRPSRTWAAVLR